MGEHGDRPKVPLSEGDREITDAAIDFLKTYDKSDPFFLSVS